MNHSEKYEAAFVSALGISKDDLPGLQYQGVAAWDSIGHMQLIFALEEAFGIMLDTSDIIDLSSFEKGKELLRKYDVEL